MALQQRSGAATSVDPVAARPARPPHRHRRLRATRRRVAFTVLALVALAMTLPVVALFISALTPSDQMGADRWLPTYFRWRNLADAVDFTPFWHLARNSVLLSTVFGVLTTFSSALAGYGFARLRGPGKK